MSNLYDKWNNTTPSIYDSDEVTTLELLEEISSFNGEIAKEIDTINKTTFSKETVEKIDKDLISINSQLKQKEKQLEDISINVKFPPSPLIPAKMDGVTDDSKSIQDIIDYLENNDIQGELFFPSGICYLANPIRTNNFTDSFTQANTKGLIFRGVGKASIIKGKGAGVLNYSSYDNTKNECLLGIHSNNNIVRDLHFIDCKNAIYIGQHPGFPTASNDHQNATHCHNNGFENLYFEKVGTAVLFQPGYGSFYNVFEKIKTQYCQIGIHLGLPPYLDNTATNPPVNNRNTFRSCYFNNGWVGILVENGDTGVIESCNFEVNDGTTSGFSKPTQLHDNKGTGIYTNDDAHFYGIYGWKVTNCHAEANTRDLYYHTRGWGFLNCEFDMSKIEVNPTSIIGSYISNGDNYSNYRWAGFHYHDLHVKQSYDYVDPFIPNVPQGVANRGVYIDGGRISDTGKRRTETDLKTNPQILELSTDSKSVYWQLGGVREWWVHGKFTKNESLSTNSPLRLFLPDTAQPNSFFDKPNIDENYKFSVIVKSDENKLETVYGYFRVSDNRIEIPSPTGGWGTSSLGNFISFQLRWF